MRSLRKAIKVTSSRVGLYSSLPSVDVQHVVGELLGTIFPGFLVAIDDQREPVQHQKHQQMEKDGVKEGKGPSQRRAEDEANQRQRRFFVRTHRAVLSVPLLLSERLDQSKI